MQEIFNDLISLNPPSLLKRGSGKKIQLPISLSAARTDEYQPLTGCSNQNNNFRRNLTIVNRENDNSNVFVGSNGKLHYSS
jgi:hypothetical protein